MRYYDFMKNMYSLAIVLFTACSGYIDSNEDEINVGTHVYENLDCSNLIQCLCQTCGTSCALCGSYDGWEACELCINYAENENKCVELINVCL
jgi:hypothetical protein